MKNLLCLCTRKKQAIGFWLREEGYAARFHNADLNYRQRRQIKSDFKDTENEIQVLVGPCTRLGA